MSDDLLSPDPMSLELSETVIGLYGSIISHLLNLRSSPTWTRSTRLTKLVCYGTVLINTAYTALLCHDIWYYGTLPDRAFLSVASGTLPQAIEPIVLSAIALVVQITLGVRSSRIIKHATTRYVYLTGIGCLAIFTFLAGIAATATSVRWHNFISDAWVPGITLRNSMMCWMWGACATDLCITIVYLIHLRRNLRGKTELSDSVVLVIGRVVIRSASYTTIFAALTAIMAQRFGDSATFFDVPYAFSGPLGALYTLSLFTTLSIGDVVERELASADRASPPAGRKA
ncbi:hypothetical protein BCR35DRAFT_324440 [Leucosporidium creatinivorum]|uniref:Uncharacterized protein n=1 Tax=Leucosporidium creatinivorum TaxID=106004 RepID=A0A1Y2FXA3_9BASI|nr:hypothetical protein BCR35DRAFT_324440 [Leucosporidium creatinivorum]